MPTWGKRSSPQDMIGQTIVGIKHEVLKDGEHQVWFYGLGVNWVFFQPIGCCNNVTCYHLDYPDTIVGMKIDKIKYNQGDFTFMFSNGAELEMGWISSKVGKKMTVDMIKLSRQDL